MKKAHNGLFILLLILAVFLGCNKNDDDDASPDLTGTTWVCDTAYYGNDYFYRLSFTSGTDFDYYEDGFVEVNDAGTYSYDPPKIDITLWGITIEGSVEGNKLYYPTLEDQNGNVFVRIFTKQ